MCEQVRGINTFAWEGHDNHGYAQQANKYGDLHRHIRYEGFRPGVGNPAGYCVHSRLKTLVMVGRPMQCAVCRGFAHLLRLVVTR